MKRSFIIRCLLIMAVLYPSSYIVLRFSGYLPKETLKYVNGVFIGGHPQVAMLYSPMARIECAAYGEEYLFIGPQLKQPVTFQFDDMSMQAIMHEAQTWNIGVEFRLDDPNALAWTQPTVTLSGTMPAHVLIGWIQAIVDCTVFTQGSALYFTFSTSP